MRDFKVLFRKLGRGFVFCLILYMIFVQVTEQIISASIKDEGMGQERNKSIVRIQKEPENTVDVLVLGDSLSYTSISPLQLWREYGFTSYVCGQPGQRIQETYYMLKTALKTQKPRVVVLETNTMFRTQGGLAGIEKSVEEWGNYYFQAIRYHNIWKSLFLKTHTGEKSYKGFGFRCSVCPYKGGDYMKETGKSEKVSELVRDYMDKILELCGGRGAKLFLYSAPSPLNYNYRIHNGLEQYANGKGLDYLDLNLKLDTMEIDWKTDSLDKGDHLNLSGARKATAYIGEYLKAGYDLPDRREDAVYADWAAESQAYRDKEEEKLEEMRREQESGV
ncbi:MAG TPA: hypothetical protein DF613_07125 [Lachnospiraceae bacterium]|nr:hypothetical protein [Lachnospiraceae bacterium]